MNFKKFSKIHPSNLPMNLYVYYMKYAIENELNELIE